MGNVSQISAAISLHSECLEIEVERVLTVKSRGLFLAYYINYTTGFFMCFSDKISSKINLNEFEL